MTSKDTQLDMMQQRAVDLCCDLTLPIVGITGGAGTGKTLVLGNTYQAIRSMKQKVAVCAPTGRASKRIEELTGIRAKTVHRLLEFPLPEECMDGTLLPNEPKRNRGNRFEERVIIVDESSMISPTLYGQLLDALPNKGVIRFFGDNNQLPPVEDEAEPPFINVLKSYPMMELMYNYRSDDDITSNANRILRGQMPQRNNRFQILYSNDPISFMIDFVTQEFAGDTHQIIVPPRKGKHGTLRINPSLQMKFNPRGPMLRLDRYDVAQGKLAVRSKDKFIWIKNDYKLDMFNGEIGRIDWLDDEEGSMSLLTGGREVLVPPRVKTYSPYHGTVIDYDPRKQIELGYAVTTHKSQGSEFDFVVYCMCRGMYFLLNRRNFYTAVTRAKKQVILITDRAAMGMALRRYDP